MSFLSTAAAGESAQAPSVFKQAKDKVSVSKVTFLILHLKFPLVIVAMF